MNYSTQVNAKQFARPLFTGNESVSCKIIRATD